VRKADEIYHCPDYQMPERFLTDLRMTLPGDCSIVH
jgi:hypothetical protein